MSEEELLAIEARANAADIPTLTAEVRKLRGEQKTPTFRVWFTKKLSASRVIEAKSIEAAQELAKALEGEIKDGEAEVGREWTAGLAVPADETRQ